ncbi:hypothetical protein [Clostridium sp. 1001283B150210_160208_E6]|uniref:hypothetical protein n=1 Tax=Clostridium sp. 1001283B150210_160208_E6 TaxID=2787129 RepID=UPI0018AA2B7F|nr:hypothetical protein [Clostridium sp. 1001283B150210_160208_E6]
MTCIIGYVDKKKKKTYLGCDSLGSDGFIKIYREDKKIFKPTKNSNFLLGFTSSYRMGQILMYSDIFPTEKEIEYEDIVVDHKWMVTEFIPSVKKIFKDNNYGKDDKGGNFLVAYKDKLFEIEPDFQVGESKIEYASVGCGEYHAYGSLFALKDKDVNITDKILTGLRSASYFTCGVDKPFYIMNTENDEILEFLE